jgi:hypothetical protein
MNLWRVIALLAWAMPVAAQTVTDGDATARHKCEFICDGDTLKLDGTT